MISASPVCTISPTLERVAGIRKVEHNGGHKIRTGPLTKPYFIGFLSFPEPAAESPSLSATICLLVMRSKGGPLPAAAD